MFAHEFDVILVGCLITLRMALTWNPLEQDGTRDLFVVVVSLLVDY